MIIYNCRRL